VAGEFPEPFFFSRGSRQESVTLHEDTHAPLSLSHLGEELSSQSPLLFTLTSPRPVAPRAFRTGVPDLREFPFQQWNQVITHCARYTLKNVTDYQDSAGYYPLREAIASHVSITRGVYCKAEQVIIVPGAQAALDMAARLLLNPGELAWIEDPGYPGAQRALRNTGAQLAPIPLTPGGIDVEFGHKRYPQGRLAFVTPSHQFPSSITMNLAQRLALLQWAQLANAWILEDDYDSDYRFSGRPLDALQGLDPAQRVIYIGTFSKVLFPALRIGYLIVPPQLISPFTNLCSCVHIHVPILEQLTLEAWISRGYFLRHIRRMREIYAARRATLIELLRRELGESVEIQPSEAGLHLVCWLPPGLHDQCIAQQASMNGLEVMPLSAFTLGSSQREGLVLGYGAVSEREIQAGVRQLARVLRS
jgi:GntR family transcriptional regulator/MocR family aminotransferase